MKILYLIKSLAAKAGTERVISDKMNWLAENGHEVFLVTYEQGNHPFAFPLHKMVVHYDIDTPFFRLGKCFVIKRIIMYILFRVFFSKRLQHVVDEIGPDYMITTTYAVQLFGIISNVKTKSKRLLESHVAFSKIKKNDSLKVNGLMSMLYELFDKKNLKYVRKFDGLIALTENDAEKWAMYINRIFVIPNPITTIPPYIDFKRSLNRIICVGRLHEQKGMDLLIEAFSLISVECPKWRIDIFGEGYEELSLRKLICKKHLEEQVYINPPTDRIYDEYMKSDFLVLSSRYEGFGLVLVEAMACGLPCISFDCPYGPRDIIEDRVNGCLVDNGNVRQLAEKMLWMINNKERRLEMGMAARNSALRYHKDTVMEKWISVFESMN